MRIPICLLLLVLLSAAAAPGDDPLAAPKRAFHLRDHAEAERLLLLHLEANRDDADAWKLLAEVYLRSERPGDAARAAGKALAAAPEDAYARASVWEAELAKAGWTPAAREALRKKVDAFLADTKDERWRLTAAFLGYSLLDAKDAKAALRKRILETMPDDPPEELEGDLLEAVVRDRTVEGRVALVHEFEQLFPESSQLNYLREIMLYMVRDDRDRLIAEATRILDAEPENRRVHAALARWLLELDPPMAGEAEPHLVTAISLLAKPQEIDRPYLASDEDFHRMLEEARGRYTGWLGRAVQLEGDPALAVKKLTEAEHLRPHDPQIQHWLGRALEATGDRERAITHYALALEAGPSPDSLARLLEILPGSGSVRDRLAARFEKQVGPTPRFADATGAAGLAKQGGRRISVSDVNGDGWPDLLLGGRRLFLNREGRFESAPLPEIKGARGGLFADLDNDGDADLLVFRTEHPMVLENDGKGAFTDRTPAALAAAGTCRTEGAAVFDADGDGLLDLYLANYEKPPTPPWARGTPDLLFRNLGGFRFEDATARISGVSAEPMCGRGAAAADFDEDGDTDLYVANYRLDPDYLLVNRGEEGLRNEARARGVEGDCDEGYFGHGIGVAWGDLDGDGHLDAVVGNLAHPRYIGFSDPTRIWLSSGPPDFTFRDVFRESGIFYEETHSNPSLADVDLDGDLDLYLTSVYRGRKSFLYLNDGEAKFRDATWLAGVRADNGWGSAFADVDLDGDPDLLVSQTGGVTLYRNAGPAGAFLGLVLEGRDCCNGTGVGARVTVEGQVREVRAGTGTGCQDDPSLRFGLGASRDPVEVAVRWPCGRVQKIAGVAPGHVYRLVEGGNLRVVR